MKSTDATPAYETLEIGTPADYTSDMYRFYFEVAEYEQTALKIIENYLGEERSALLVKRDHGYELELAIQCVPDLTSELVNGDVGVYQIVRYAKTKNSW